MTEIWLLSFVADWFANIPDASGIGLLDSVIDLHKRKEMIYSAIIARNAASCSGGSGFQFGFVSMSGQVLASGVSAGAPYQRASCPQMAPR